MNDDRPCPNCAQPVRATAVYCPHCGSPQPDPAPIVTDLLVPSPPTGTPWRAREALGVFLSALLITAVVLAVLAATDMDEDTLTVTGVLVHEIILIAFTIGWVGVRYGARPSALGLRRFTAANLGIGLGVGLAGLIVSAAASGVLQWALERLRGVPVSQPDQIPLSADPTGGVLVMLGISVVFLAPVAEEIFFRGFMFAGLRRWMALGPAVLLSAAIFAVTHVIPLVMLPIFMLGALLAFVSERRKSIVPAIVAHMAFNGVGFWALYLAEPVARTP